MDNANKAQGRDPAFGLSVDKLMREINELQLKLDRGARRLATLTEAELAIATAPKDEIFAADMMRLYHYRPQAKKPLRIPVLIAYALVGRYQMIDLEPERSFVRRLLARGLDVYAIDWGLPKRAQRWLTIDDYVNAYLDDCVDVVARHSGVDKINLLGICQGGVFATCYAALHPGKIRTLVIVVTPLDFHGDAAKPERGSGYMNLWSRAMTQEDIDLMIDTLGSIPGAMVGFSFLMMNPVLNVTKYTTELVDILDDDAKLLNFLHMERWIADRPDHPGEFARQWFKDLYQGNKLIKNELMLGNRRVDLRNVAMPVLNVIADGDVVIPTSCSTGMAGKFGTKDYRELLVPGGHIGTFVGAKAQKILAPGIVEWLMARNKRAAAK